MDHEEEVAYVLGEAPDPQQTLPLARDVRTEILAMLDQRQMDPSLDEAALFQGRNAPRVRALALEAVSQASRATELFDVLRKVETLVTVVEERFRRGWTNLDQRLGSTQSDVTSSRDETRAAIFELQIAIGAVQSSVATLVQDVSELAPLMGWRQELSALRKELDVLRRTSQAARVDATSLERLVAKIGAGAVEGGALEDALAEHRSARFDTLYLSFEEEFRGSRQAIKSLHRKYLDDVKRRPLTGPILDIGPGRCEWLELLREEGIPAYGIDTNERMAALGSELGVEVHTGDAVAHLKAIEAGSLGAVTAMHVVEHLDFDVLVDALDSALGALQPGGLLILETPNPDNLRVGSANFWLDPTHHRPIPPPLLRFVVEARGFVDVEVRPLHPVASRPPPSEPRDAVREDIVDALYGPQDYAVVARTSNGRIDASDRSV